MEKVIFGNGQKGLQREFADHRTEFASHCAKWEQREKDKMTYDDRQEKKMNLLIAIASLVLVGGGTLVSFLAFVRK